MKRLPNFCSIQDNNIKRYATATGHYIDNKFDLHAGAGCNVLGYANPIFLDAITENYDKITNNFWRLSNSVWEEFEELLAIVTDKRYSSYITGLTGSDSIESALKILWYGSEESEHVILVRKNSYHAGTVAGWQMINDKSISQDWPKMEFVEFFDDLEEKVKEVGADRIAGVLIDTVPWYGGLHEKSLTYWKHFQQTVDKYNLRLCVDEILTGMGRTGAWLHSHYLGLKPDILVLGKALAAGHENLSLCLLNDKILNSVGDKWLAIGNTRSNNTQAILLTSVFIKYLINNDIIDYVNKAVIPYCGEIHKILTSKGFRSYQVGSMVQAHGNTTGLSLFLNQNGMYHDWDCFWHLPFFDITPAEMNKVINKLENYNG